MQKLIRALWLAGLAACAPNPHETRYSDVVWADDDGELLVCGTEWDESGSGSWRSESNLVRHIGRWTTAGEKLGTVGSFPLDPEGSPYCGTGNFHFMRGQGYAVVGGFLVALSDGTAHRLGPEQPDLLPSWSALPSPDGTMIAVVNRGSGRFYSTRHETVSFVDPDSRAVVGGAYLCPEGACELTWMPTGELVVATGSLTTAATMSLDGQLTPVSRPRCFDPPTTSSPVSSAGDVVSIDSYGTITIARGAGVAFGCQ